MSESQKNCLTFDTLFLAVKDIDTDKLTKPQHPFGWLMTVLKNEHADETVMQETLETTLSHLDTLAPEQAAQHRNAMIYLYHLVLFRRSETEQDNLIRLIQTHTQDKEVENIIMTGAEALIEQGKAEGIEQGKAEGIVESILDMLTMRFPSDDILSIKPQLARISDLNRLKTLNRTTYTTESFIAFTEMLHNNR